MLHLQPPDRGSLRDIARRLNITEIHLCVQEVFDVGDSNHLINVT